MTTTNETPEAHSVLVDAGYSSEQYVPSRVDRDAPIDALLHDLSRRLAELRGHAQPENPASPGALVSQVDVCSALINLIDTKASETRQRLARAESLIHEQTLQLQARVAESQTDGLTGIANRRSFDRQLHERCAASRVSRCPTSVVLIDIDHFKNINDTYGHHVGDAVLRGLASLFRDRLPPGTLLARYGGEEFVIALHGTFLDHVVQLAEELRSQVCRTRFRHENQNLLLTISCGLAQLDPSENPGRLVQRADTAMYAAKQAGRNRTFWHDGQELHLATCHEDDPPHAVRSEDRDLACPVVDLNTCDEWWTASPLNSGAQSASALFSKSARANWCDGAMLFWYVRQRIEELKHGGDAFCVLALDVDNAQHITRRFGLVALHFMMRAQMLHLDATLRDMDVVARTSHSRIIAILPRLTLERVAPVLARLRDTMDRFTYPTATDLLEYSISAGVTEAAGFDDATRLVVRAETALDVAQSRGTRQFFACAAAPPSVLGSPGTVPRSLFSADGSGN
ncbi:MAG: diguanylate cyclase [Planctomycetes bacterium]|nr:diguanylate cyclase [Planctomycetota bacterium]